MNRTSPSEVKAWCIGRGFHPNKVLGQNFLIDRNILGSIADAAGDVSGRRVLEVGPGLGVMTEELLKRGAAVTAIEKDPVLARALGEDLGAAYPALSLHCADALEVDWDALLEEGFAAFVSNLPYSVGTRILLDLALRRRAPERLVVMVQTEVAERLAAPAGSPARGQAGVWCQLHYDVSILRKVKPVCFWPRPEVDSSVVLLNRHRRCILSAVEEETFLSLTRKVFMHRRKQIGTLLRKDANFAGNFMDALRRAGISPETRGEALTLPQWECLVQALSNPA